MPESLELQSPLWHFALALWQDGETEQICLSLQGRGWSVTRLLCALWLARHGVRPCPEPESVTKWREQVTGTLRALRQGLPRESTAVGSLRKTLAEAELKAEQVELALAFPALSAHIQQSGKLNKDTELIRAHLHGSAPDSMTLDRETDALMNALIQRVRRNTDQFGEISS